MKRKKKEKPVQFISNDGKHSYRYEGNTLHLNGQLKLLESGRLARNVLRKLSALNPSSLTLNLDRLEDIDSSGVMALHFVKDKLSEKGTHVEVEGGSEEVRKKMELFGHKAIEKVTRPPHRSYPEVLGAQVQRFFLTYAYGFLLLAANVFYWSLADLFNTKSRRKGEFVNQAVLIGVNASLIVLFMSFVIGLVLAMHSSGQLRLFGANIFIVDLTVIAVMSQMGPLITAILVAGRSGSAIAAEIATMKVTAELDALKTMGLDPIRFVVVPKLYAALLTMPFLIIIANVSGIFGGGVAAYVYLDITPEIFINRMRDVMQGKDLLTAFVKSQVYASIIVLTGTFYGFRVAHSAEGVGKVTTIAVVVSISLVILADSILGLIFY